MSLVVCAITLVLALDADAPWVQPAPAAIAGHGVLSAGLDHAGALTVLRWPGPGGPNHLRQIEVPTGEGSEVWSAGGRWGLSVAGRWYWTGDPAARTSQKILYPGGTVIETLAEWPESGIQLRQRSGILESAGEVFISAIEVSGAPSGTRLVWIADFAPATRQLPELAGGEGVLGATNGFAAFTAPAPARAWSFRPKAPGAANWTRARDLTGVRADPESWDKFPDGAWIGVAGGDDSPHPVDARVASSARELLDAIGRGSPTPEAVVGPSSIAMEFRGTSSWIQVAIAENRQRAGKALDDARGADGFFDTATTDDSSSLSTTTARTHSPLLVQPHWAVLQALRDPRTGFTARGLSVDPPLARDWPRDGAIVAWALLELGEVAAAQKSIEAYLAKIRLDARLRQPFGSMPESLYTSGEPASAHFIVDDRGPARVLWVAERIVRARPDPERRQWVRQHWKSIEAAAEFLSIWADTRRGAPLYSDDPVGLRDAETQDHLFAAYGGMSAALRLAQHAGEPVPEVWHNRRTQLLALVDWVLSEPGKWVPGGSLLLETEGISEQSLARLAESAASSIVASSRPEAEKLARMLLQRAVLPGHHDRAEILVAELERLDARPPGATFSPDSLVSAEVLLTILLP